MRTRGLWITIVVFTCSMSIARDNTSPYSGEQKREIKSMSAAEVTMYIEGAGMGLAKAAELNGYPGPMHVLELSSELELSDAQEAQTAALFKETKAEARRVGQEVVALERELDRKFAAGTITEDELVQLVSEIGAKEAELRLVHLRAHLRQEAILNDEQVSRYIAARGYIETGSD